MPQHRSRPRIWCDVERIERTSSLICLRLPNTASPRNILLTRAAALHSFCFCLLALRSPICDHIYLTKLTSDGPCLQRPRQLLHPFKRLYPFWLSKTSSSVRECFAVHYPFSPTRTLLDARGTPCWRGLALFSGMLWKVFTRIASGSSLSDSGFLASAPVDTRTWR